jgi:acyl-[acyl-carrier-protein] desaturase
MPAQRESGEKRIRTVSAADYIDIMQKLMTRWEIDKITGLTDEAEKARDYLMKLPARMTRVSERMTIPQESHILGFFRWKNNKC